MPFVELQKMLDEANAWGLHCYDKGCYVEALSDDVIERRHRALPRQDLAAVAGAVLPARRRVLASAGGRDGLQRRPVTAVRRLRHRGLPGAGDAARRAGVGADAWPMPSRRPRRTTASTSTGSPTSTRATRVRDGVRPGEVRPARRGQARPTTRTTSSTATPTSRPEARDAHREGG